MLRPNEELGLVVHFLSEVVDQCASGEDDDELVMQVE